MEVAAACGEEDTRLHSDGVWQPEHFVRCPHTEGLGQLLKRPWRASSPPKANGGAAAGAPSLLLIGDSVDRKLWETLNNSRHHEPLKARMCVATTSTIAVPELAVSWLSPPSFVSGHAPASVAALKRAWRCRKFDDRSKGALDELDTHRESNLALESAGRVRINYGGASSATSSCMPNLPWQVLRGWPSCAVSTSSPTAVVVAPPVFHMLWTMFTRSRSPPMPAPVAGSRSRAAVDDDAAAGTMAWYLAPNQSLPDVLVAKLTSNLHLYCAAIQQAFPHARCARGLMPPPPHPPHILPETNGARGVRVRRLLGFGRLVLRTAQLPGGPVGQRTTWASSASLARYVAQLNDVTRHVARQLGPAADVWDVGAMFATLAGPELYSEPDRLHLHPLASIQALLPLLSSMI